MTRVLQIGKYFPPASGGIEAVTAAIRSELAPLADVTTLVANHDEGQISEPYPPLSSRQAVIRSRNLGRLFSMPICPSLPAELARYTSPAAGGEGADVVLLHYPNPMAAAAFVMARPQCPLVVFYHSDIVRQRAMGAAIGCLTNNVLRRADAIVVTSPTLLIHSKTLRPFRHKCVVVPLGIDPKRWMPLDSTADSGVIAPSDSLHRAFTGRTVLFAGRLVYYKGVGVLLKAMTSVPEAQLVLVGRGPLGPRLRRQSRDLGIADRVHFAGRVSDERLRDYYRAASVFVLPSIAASEAFGIVQLEAMAAGTPVVSTRLKTGVPWVNRHRMTGLTVPPKDPIILAEALRELLDRPALASRYGSNGQRRVLRRFTLEHFRKRLWRVLETVLVSGGGNLKPRPRRRSARPTVSRPAARVTEVVTHA